MKKSLQYRAILLPSYCGILCLFLTSCALSPHDDAAWTTLQKVASPDGKFVAAFANSNDLAGATGSSYQIVTVKDTGCPSKADDGIALKMYHGYEVRLRWASKNDLVIEHSQTAVILQKTNQVGPVKVKFVPRPALYGLFKSSVTFCL